MVYHAPLLARRSRRRILATAIVTRAGGDVAEFDLPALVVLLLGTMTTRVQRRRVGRASQTRRRRSNPPEPHFLDG